jgi:hypothetical protein
MAIKRRMNLIQPTYYKLQAPLLLRQLSKHRASLLLRIRETQGKNDRKRDRKFVIFIETKRSSPFKNA